MSPGSPTPTEEWSQLRGYITTRRMTFTLQLSKDQAQRNNERTAPSNDGPAHIHLCPNESIVYISCREKGRRAWHLSARCVPKTNAPTFVEAHGQHFVT